ncbi:MAG: heme ABC transporter permease CcmB [Desulfovibrionales bacterium]|nr:heme ABC transporter permease CcmB [Desulfovibrionales bacterium]
MIGHAMAVAHKDLRLAFAHGQGPVQAILLGLLLVFMFSLSAQPGERFTPQQGVAIFWLCSAFGVVLIFSLLFRFEEENDTATALLLSPLPIQGLWLGKTMAGFVLLALCQVFFFPAALVFLGLDPGGSLGSMLVMVVSVDLGLCILGGLVGAMGHGQGAKDALLTIIVFPLQIPLLLGGIRIGVGLMQGEDLAGLGDWFGLVLAFDAVFAGAALFLFPHVFRGE